MVEAAVEVARLDRGAVPGGKDQPGIDPAISGPVTVCILLYPADIKSSHAQIRQGKGRLRRLRLDLTADELVADALELLPHIQLSVIKVCLFPGKAEDFTPAQAEDQDEGRVQRFTGMPD